MSLPKGFFLGLLALWGWQTELWWMAAAVAVALELSHWIQSRWDLTVADLDRIWNLCAGLFFCLIAYLLASQEHGLGLAQSANLDAALNQAVRRGARATLTFFQWLPLIFLPMLLAQVWGSLAAIPLSTFSWFLRKSRAKANPRHPEPCVNITWIGAGLFLMGAGAGPRTEVFLPATAGLTLWALWPRRNRRYPVLAWLGSLALAGGLTWSAQASLRPLYFWLQRLENQLLQRGVTGGFDPRESRMRLGHVTSLKGSGAIVLRVEVPEGRPPPALLREATYHQLRGSVWQNTPTEPFRAVPGDSLDLNWTLVAATNENELQRARIWTPLRYQRSLLPVPSGSTRLENLPASVVQTNAAGSVRAEAPSFVGFDAFYHPIQLWDGEPNASDLAVPESEDIGLRTFLSQLPVSQPFQPEAFIRRLMQTMADQFQYSLAAGTAPARKGSTPLSHFLLHDRRGHCEAFATAGALLLRTVGIPARYAVGWSVQERKGSHYVVRSRHAHAWVLAYVGGAWRDIDFTPSSWFESERQERSSFEAFSDFWSSLVFAIQRWRYAPQSSLRLWLLVPAILALVLALIQLVRRGSWRRQPSAASATARRDWPGQESPFYTVERELRVAGWDRRLGEPLGPWIERIRQRAPCEPSTLDQALQLHYRFRFDPLGLSAEDRTRLHQACSDCLHRIRTRPRN